MATRKNIKETAMRILGNGEPEFTMLNSDPIDLIHALNHYARTMTYEDSKRFALEWASSKAPALVKGLLKASPSDITNSGFLCRIMENGFVDDAMETRVTNELKDIAAKAMAIEPEVVQTAQPRATKRAEPNAMREQFDAAMDCIVQYQDHEGIVFTDNRKHVDELLAIVKRLQDEVQEFPELYPNFKAVKKFLKETADRIDTFVAKVKTNRIQKRTPRKIDPVKMVSNLVLAASDDELGIKTMKATTIIGANKLIVWNAERRTLTAFIAMNENGFLVSGRSLKNFDPEKSITKKIRKPKEMWEAIKNMTATRMHYWLRDDCKTTASPAKALIPDGSIIVKV